MGNSVDERLARLERERLQSLGRFVALYAAVQTMAAEPLHAARPHVYRRLLEKSQATLLTTTLTDVEMAVFERSRDLVAEGMLTAFAIGIDPKVEPELRNPFDLFDGA